MIIDSLSIRNSSKSGARFVRATPTNADSEQEFKSPHFVPEEADCPIKFATNIARLRGGLSINSYRMQDSRKWRRGKEGAAQRSFENPAGLLTRGIGGPL